MVDKAIYIPRTIITAKEDVWRRLTELKNKGDYRSMNALILDLILFYEKYKHLEEEVQNDRNKEGTGIPVATETSV